VTAAAIATLGAQFTLVLAAAALMGRLAGRVGLPAVLGELCAGVALGPSLLGPLAPEPVARLIDSVSVQASAVHVAGQIGLLLLVGITGTHVDVGLVRRRGATAARVSAGGLVIPLGLGVACGFLLPDSLLGETDRGVFALFIGVALCVSAIPVIARTLIDMRLLHRDIGQLTLSAAMVDDAAGWLLLSVVSALATTGVHAETVASSLARLAALLAFALLLGRPLVRLAIGAATRTGNPALTAVIVAALVLAAAQGAGAIGCEPIVGAFVCGTLIGTRLDFARAAPLRVLVVVVLAPIFFVSAGLKVDLTALARPDVALAAAAVLGVAVAGKFAGAYLGARLSRLDRWEAVSLGAGLNARGVIEVVIATAGLQMGVLNEASYTIIVLVAIATSLMAPPLLRFATRRIPITAEERLREVAFAL
jgi:K+:H+ antiporter